MRVGEIERVWGKKVDILSATRGKVEILFRM